MSDPLAGQALNVQELKRIADEKETAKLKEVLARRQKEEEEEKRARQDFMEREIRPGRHRALQQLGPARGRAGPVGDRDPALPVAVLHATMAGRSTTSRPAGPDTLTGAGAQGCTTPTSSICRARATRSGRRS